PSPGTSRPPAARRTRCSSRRPRPYEDGERGRDRGTPRPRPRRVRPYTRTPRSPGGPGTPHVTVAPCPPAAPETGANAMADLQDEPHSVGVGAEDVPVTAPLMAGGSLDRAAALLAVHPVADGCNTLVWTLRQSPYHDIDTPDTGVDTDIPRLRAGG